MNEKNNVEDNKLKTNPFSLGESWGEVLKKLNLLYYAVFLDAVLMAVVGYFFAKYGIKVSYDSALGIALSSASFLLLLISLPLILKWFSKKTKEIAVIENETEKIIQYKKTALIRLCVVGVNFSLNILLFYLVESNSFSFLFAAGIAAVVLYICTPTETKMKNDLTSP